MHDKQMIDRIPMAVARAQKRAREEAMRIRLSPPSKDRCDRNYLIVLAVIYAAVRVARSCTSMGRMPQMKNPRLF